MENLIKLTFVVCLLHAGQSSYFDGHSGYSSAVHAPVGYHGPLTKTIVLKSGHIADTPEVSAAKHLHYSAVQKAKTTAAGHGYSETYGSGAGYGSLYTPGGYGSSYTNVAEHAPVGYHGPLAKTIVLKSGHIADTPEVSAAKHLHYSAVQKAKTTAAAHGYSETYGSGASYGSLYTPIDYGSSYTNVAEHAPVGYHGPLAKIVVLKTGHIADTPEVTAAKYLHYSALQKATASTAAHGYSRAGYDDLNGSGHGYGETYGSGQYASSYKSYSGPLAYPKVLASGQLADTNDVAAARHAHLNAFALTASEHAQKWANNYYH